MFEELGIAILLIPIICWGFGDFLIQKATRKVGDIEALMIIGIIASIILLPFILPDIGLILEPSNLIMLTILGAITFVAAIILFESYKEGKLSVIEVLQEVEVPVAIIFAVFILKEIISLEQTMLIVIIFVGLVLTALKSINHLKEFTKLEKGFILGLVGAIGLGLVDSLTAFGAREISPLTVIWFPHLILSILCIIVVIKEKRIKKVTTGFWLNKKLLISMGLLDVTAWTFYSIILENNSLAITTAITEIYPIIGIALGVTINKEKIKRHQWLGIIITIIACIILAATIA
jgi:drug/metabolite transporter (DMT)-like permease